MGSHCSVPPQPNLDLHFTFTHACTPREKKSDNSNFGNRIYYVRIIYVNLKAVSYLPFLQCYGPL